MNKVSVFLAAPMSSFEDEEEYRTFRNSILRLISYLRQSDFTVISEIESIIDQKNYDSPAESARKDFAAINKADIFLLVHQKKVQTSALVELGYAYALNKRIVIVSQKRSLPYLVQGLPEIAPHVSIVELCQWDESVFSVIRDMLYR